MDSKQFERWVINCSLKLIRNVSKIGARMKSKVDANLTKLLRDVHRRTDNVDVRRGDDLKQKRN